MKIISLEDKITELDKYPIEDFLEEDFIQVVLINKQNKLNP